MNKILSLVTLFKRPGLIALALFSSVLFVLIIILAACDVSTQLSRASGQDSAPITSPVPTSTISSSSPVPDTSTIPSCCEPSQKAAADTATIPSSPSCCSSSPATAAPSSSNYATVTGGGGGCCGR